jgi:hypothetical protein
MNGLNAFELTAIRHRGWGGSPPVVWRRPSDKDQDRLGDPLDNVVVADALAEHLEVVGAGAVRGIVLHKLMEEFLTGELDADVAVTVARAQELLGELLTDQNDKLRQDLGAASCCRRTDVTRSLRRLTDTLRYRLNPMRDSCLGEGDAASSTLRRFRPSMEKGRSSINLKENSSGTCGIILLLLGCGRWGFTPFLLQFPHRIFVC